MGMNRTINPGGGGGGGEIVQVQGGHIVRSTGRKDRHSKVSTAKGPRDRRVRLSAHTAIQFYDVQDRLGYDRPSKAVDWLIKKAKSAIDNLAELPPWHPTAAAAAAPDPDPTVPHPHPSGYAGFHRGQPELGDPADVDDPVGLSFFPTAAASDAHHHHHHGGVNFQNYPPDHLGLSLQSFHGGDAAPCHAAEQQALFGFGSGGSNFQRMLAWHGGHDPSSGGGGFNAAAAAAFNGNYQRGTLQSSSSFSQLVRAWDDLPSSMAAESTSAHKSHHQQHLHQIHQSASSVFGTRFVPDANGGGGFPVFCIPARIHGEDEGEQHGVVSERPSSSSSEPNSTHR